MEMRGLASDSVEASRRRKRRLRDRLCRSESVSRVLYPCGWRSFLWADDCSPAQATIPEALRAGSSASYLVLLRMGFGMRARLLARRWALTPPFHPYPFGRCIFCATFRESPRAAVTGHPALWSPDFPLPIEGKRSPDSLRRRYSITFLDRHSARLHVFLC